MAAAQWWKSLAKAVLTEKYSDLIMFILATSNNKDNRTCTVLCKKKIILHILNPTNGRLLIKKSSEHEIE